METKVGKDLTIYYHILKDTWLYLLVLLLNFSTTLAVSPAVTALIKPKSTGKYLYNGTCFILLIDIIKTIRINLSFYSCV